MPEPKQFRRWKPGGLLLLGIDAEAASQFLAAWFPASGLGGFREPSQERPSRRAICSRAPCREGVCTPGKRCFGGQRWLGRRMVLKCSRDLENMRRKWNFVGVLVGVSPT